MNYFPFHVGDYASHTAHLEPLEDLAYRRMLDLYYMREEPLPEDVDSIARLIRLRGNKDEIRLVLNEFFSFTPEGYRHHRCDAELAKMKDRQTKALASARASVSARRANAERTLNERSTEVELPTPTPTPIDSESKDSGGKPPKLTDPNEIIFGYGLPMLTAAGNTEKNARSFLGGLRKEHGDDAVIDKLRECAKTRPLQPLEWLAAALPPKTKPGKHTGFDQKNYREGVAADGSLV